MFSHVGYSSQFVNFSQNRQTNYAWINGADSKKKSHKSSNQILPIVDASQGERNLNEEREAGQIGPLKTPTEWSVIHRLSCAHKDSYRQVKDERINSKRLIVVKSEWNGYK